MTVEPGSPFPHWLSVDAIPSPQGSTLPRFPFSIFTASTSRSALSVLSRLIFRSHISAFVSGDVHVQSLLLCCWKRVFVRTSAFSWQNSISYLRAAFPGKFLVITQPIIAILRSFVLLVSLGCAVHKLSPSRWPLQAQWPRLCLPCAGRGPLTLPRPDHPRPPTGPSSPETASCL